MGVIKQRYYSIILTIFNIVIIQIEVSDIVLTIQKRQIFTNKKNKVTKFELSIDLSAAGATKSIGAAIMLDNVPATAITQSVEFNDKTLVRNFNLNNNNIENGQDDVIHVIISI